MTGSRLALSGLVVPAVGVVESPSCWNARNSMEFLDPWPCQPVGSTASVCPTKLDLALTSLMRVSWSTSRVKSPECCEEWLQTWIWVKLIDRIGTPKLDTTNDSELFARISGTKLQHFVCDCLRQASRPIAE
eukprot:s2296_g6.t1